AAECFFDVYPESFDPSPKVMSAIIKLIPHPKPPVVVNDLMVFKQVVTQAFSQRRKTLRNSLKKLIGEDCFVSLGIDPIARAETISLFEFANLSNWLAENTD
ncbi:MAG: 16S rRNA (adenine(1518)-N(6)/adenine(1519)-N(6))-dimethyltransferase, partial [Proteobacteria bacterium]|nr:16S rRNA (adenine(1518)-N(6)/adenine(1519)-N(6))-dimethyltransferase [Pseudomonadota bacterium]